MVSRVSSASLLERLVTVEAAAKAAHGRMDKIEVLVAQALSDLNREMKELVALANRAKGALWIVGVLGTVVGAVIMKVLSKWIG